MSKEIPMVVCEECGEVGGGHKDNCSKKRVAPYHGAGLKGKPGQRGAGSQPSKERGGKGKGPMGQGW